MAAEEDIVWVVMHKESIPSAPEAVRLECEDMQVLHDALTLHLDRLQGMAQAHGKPMTEYSSEISRALDELSKAVAEEKGIDLAKVEGDMLGQLSRDFIRTKALKNALVNLVGEDMTGGGC